MAKPKKKAPDWEAIEREFRAGQLSNAQIARQHGLTPAAITMKAKREGWVKDLSEQVRERVRAELVNDAVNESVNAANAREIIEAGGLRGAEVVRAHRKDIAKGRALVELLFGQLAEAASQRDEIEETIEEETAEDRSPLRRASMLKAIGIPSHAGALRDLTTALKNLIPLERQAFNLDEPSQGEAHTSKEQRDAAFRAAFGGDHGEPDR